MSISDEAKFPGKEAYGDVFDQREPIQEQDVFRDEDSHDIQNKTLSWQVNLRSCLNVVSQPS